MLLVATSRCPELLAAVAGGRGALGDDCGDPARRSSAARLPDGRARDCGDHRIRLSTTSAGDDSATSPPVLRSVPASRCRSSSRCCSPRRTARSRVAATSTTLLSPALSLTPSASVRALLGTVQDRDPAIFAGGFESIAFIGVVVALLVAVGVVQVGALPTVATLGDRAGDGGPLGAHVGDRPPYGHLSTRVRDRSRIRPRPSVGALGGDRGPRRRPVRRRRRRRDLARSAATSPRCGSRRHHRSDRPRRRSMWSTPSIGGRPVIWAVTAAVAMALLIANAAVRSSPVARGAAVAILVLAGAGTGSDVGPLHSSAIAHRRDLHQSPHRHHRVPRASRAQGSFSH